MDKSFFKHAAVYALANLLIQGGGFVLLPIYLRCLTPADYGVLEAVGRVAESVGTCPLFGGFRQALHTFSQQAGGEAERRRVVGTALAQVGGRAPPARRSPWRWRRRWGCGWRRCCRAAAPTWAPHCCAWPCWASCSSRSPRSRWG
jgi:hypothetical protein